MAELLRAHSDGFAKGSLVRPLCLLHTGHHWSSRCLRSIVILLLLRKTLYSTLYLLSQSLYSTLDHNPGALTTRPRCHTFLGGLGRQSKKKNEKTNDNFQFRDNYILAFTKPDRVLGLIAR